MITPTQVTDAASAIRYSICTLVTNPGQYDGCAASFQNHGFGSPDCEFLFIDNTNGNTHDAYTGINLLLRKARGTYVILCHQDIVLLDDDRDKLDLLISEMNRRFPNWGVLGNSGGLHSGELALRITEPRMGTVSVNGPFPRQVISLDENFLVVRASANLALSGDLSGFHMYGADLCLVADILGHSAWVIDFHLRHLSPGVNSPALVQSGVSLRTKYARALRSRIMTTTCATVPLTASRWLGLLSRSSKGLGLWRRFMPEREVV